MIESMGLKADLHMHTNFSDGELSPNELLALCVRKGLSIISITDHDSVSAFPDAAAQGKKLGLEVIAGVELSASLDDKDIHILGYFVNYENKRLQEYLEFFRIERVKRAERIVAKLNALNIPLKFESVMERAGIGSVGRPHIASALLDQGFIKTYHEAFDRYIGNSGPAYEKKFQLSPEEAIQLISSSGGLSFLAHPGRFTSEEVIQHLIKKGLDGIEVIHPSHTPAHSAHYRGIVGEYFLLESGGSDFHGGKKSDGVTLGEYFIDGGKVEMMKNRLFSQQLSK